MKTVIRKSDHCHFSRNRSKRMMKISLQADYLWLMQSKIGPFVTSGFSNEFIEFPESKIRYNHMSMDGLVGVHLFKSRNWYVSYCG